MTFFVYGLAQAIENGTCGTDEDGHVGRPALPERVRPADRADDPRHVHRGPRRDRRRLGAPGRRAARSGRARRSRSSPRSCFGIVDLNADDTRPGFEIIVAAIAPAVLFAVPALAATDARGVDLRRAPRRAGWLLRRVRGDAARSGRRPDERVRLRRRGDRPARRRRPARVRATSRSSWPRCERELGPTAGSPPAPELERTAARSPAVVGNRVIYVQIDASGRSRHRVSETGRTARLVPLARLDAAAIDKIVARSAAPERARSVEGLSAPGQLRASGRSRWTAASRTASSPTSTAAACGSRTSRTRCRIGAAPDSLLRAENLAKVLAAARKDAPAGARVTDFDIRPDRVGVQLETGNGRELTPRLRLRRRSSRAATCAPTSGRRHRLGRLRGPSTPSAPSGWPAPPAPAASEASRTSSTCCSNLPSIPGEKPELCRCTSPDGHDPRLRASPTCTGASSPGPAAASRPGGRARASSRLVLAARARPCRRARPGGDVGPVAGVLAQRRPRGTSAEHDRRPPARGSPSLASQ